MKKGVLKVIFLISALLLLALSVVLITSSHSKRVNNSANLESLSWKTVVI